jgi:hypothetical protein
VADWAALTQRIGLSEWASAWATGRGATDWTSATAAARRQQRDSRYKGGAPRVHAALGCACAAVGLCQLIGSSKKN